MWFYIIVSCLLVIMLTLTYIRGVEEDKDLCRMFKENQEYFSSYHNCIIKVVCIDIHNQMIDIIIMDSKCEYHQLVDVCTLAHWTGVRLWQ